MKDKAIREWAQGHPEGCQIRLPGCQWTPTVGAHLPSGVRFGKGTGKKPDDLLIALACDHCHSVVDGRIKTDFEKDFVRLAWWEGFGATLQLRRKEGVL